jgi:hypothetical protein
MFLKIPSKNVKFHALNITNKRRYDLIKGKKYQLVVIENFK